MKQSETCPKCSSTDIMADVKIVEHQHSFLSKRKLTINPMQYFSKGVRNTR